MKRVRPDGTAAAPLRMISPSAGSRSSETLGVDGACCIRCPDEPCVRFRPDECVGGNTNKVCPTDSIHHARSTTGPVVSTDCVGCGLCVMRCPVGALAINRNGVAEVAPPDPKKVEPVDDDADFFASRASHQARSDWPDRSWADIATRLARTGADLRQAAFYPLVAILFTAAGHPAWQPAHGDTSNRIDLILADDVDSLPVEVKSRTESPIVNVKSVQQALENRVVLDERAFFAAVRDSSTLVVGYDYPPKRSDVNELVEDIARAFAVNVGLISLSDLYDLALRRQMAGVDVPRSRLSQLRGALT